MQHCRCNSNLFQTFSLNLCSQTISSDTNPHGYDKTVAQGDKCCKRGLFQRIRMMMRPYRIHQLRGKLPFLQDGPSQLSMVHTEQFFFCLNKAAFFAVNHLHYFFKLICNKNAEETLANIMKKPTGKSTARVNILYMPHKKLCHNPHSNRMPPHLSLLQLISCSHLTCVKFGTTAGNNYIFQSIMSEYNQGIIQGCHLPG